MIPRLCFRYFSQFTVFDISRGNIIDLKLVQKISKDFHGAFAELMHSQEQPSSVVRANRSDIQGQ